MYELLASKHDRFVWHTYTSPSRCTLAKATDQHYECAAAQLAIVSGFGPQGEVLLDGLLQHGNSVSHDD